MSAAPAPRLHEATAAQLAEGKISFRCTCNELHVVALGEPAFKRYEPSVSALNVAALLGLPMGLADLFCLLLDRDGQVVTHRELLLRFYGDESAGDPLRQRIYNLRKKLRGTPYRILTVAGLGVRLVREGA